MEEIFAKNKQQVFLRRIRIFFLNDETDSWKESETISVDDVADIFKMYGVDYKEVCIKYVLEVIFKLFASWSRHLHGFLYPIWPKKKKILRLF